MKKTVALVFLVFGLMVASGCADSGGLNACGGTSDLQGAPGEACGDCGVWVCDGKDAVVCDDPGYNACGGCAELEHQPGESCGDCSEYVCFNENAVQCQEKTNACGGCSRLEHKPGDPCGECGEWVCDGLEGVKCDDPGYNDCGGCTVLPHSIGESCGDCGQYVCSGTEAVKCDDPGLNACGGCAELPGGVGDACGTCGEGAYECQGTEAMVCGDPDGAMGDAVDLGSYTDADNDAGDFYGRLYPGEDEVDWYVTHVDDEWNANMTPWFRITVPAGTTYRMCAYFDSSEMDGCNSGTPDTYNGLSGCCGSDIEFDVGGSTGQNSGGWVYIRVEYTQDSSPTCDPYHVTFGF